MNGELEVFEMDEDTDDMEAIVARGKKVMAAYMARHLPLDRRNVSFFIFLFVLAQACCSTARRLALVAAGFAGGGRPSCCVAAVSWLLCAAAFYRCASVQTLRLQN